MPEYNIVTFRKSAVAVIQSRCIQSMDRSSAIVIRCRLFVFRLSVTRVYCDKTAEVRIMQFYYNVAQWRVCRYGPNNK